MVKNITCVKIAICIFIYFPITSILLFTSSIFAAEELASISAVVGDEIITKSELDEQFQFILLSGLIKPEDSLQIDSLKLDFLNQLINRKVLVEYAEQETIEVTPEEIEESLNRALEDMRADFPDEESFKQKLKEEGLDLETFKENYRKQIKENLLLQKLMQTQFGSEMIVSEKDIREFYNANRDSFAEPQKIELAHILIMPKPSSQEVSKIEETVNDIFLRLEFNEPFESIAKKYSQGKFKNRGGDIGYVSKGELPPEIADVAFSLAREEITVARAMDGFYIIKCADRKADKRHLKQIFLNLQVTAIDTLRAKNQATKISNLANEGTDFSSLVQRYSDDIETKKNDGMLGEVYVDQLHPLFRDAVKDLKEGEISEPVKTEFGFHIFKVVSKPEPTIPELDEIRNLVKEYIIQQRTKEKTDELLKKILPNFYVKNFLKEKLCPKTEDK
jgi:peptidyl-prolyl cis-trans isomerase SurA